MNAIKMLKALLGASYCSLRMAAHAADEAAIL